MLMTVGVVAVLAIAAVLVYAATKHDTFLAQRSALIDAAPEDIFPLIDDLRAQSAWSPFEKDANITRTHSGAPRGRGAVYEWDGNRQVGAGRIAITESVPPSKVVLLLDMYRPFKAQNTVEFTLERVSGHATTISTKVSTRVTWSMRGRQPYMAKLFSLVMNCDKMVGSQFEEGLGKLKSLVETPAMKVAAE